MRWRKKLVKKVGIGDFDAVVIGDWEAVGVRIVNSSGVGDHGFGALCCGRGHDRDELAEKVTFGAQVGCPLGEVGPRFVILAWFDDAWDVTLSKTLLWRRCRG